MTNGDADLKASRLSVEWHPESARRLTGSSMVLGYCTTWAAATCEVISYQYWVTKAETPHTQLCAAEESV